MISGLPRFALPAILLLNAAPALAQTKDNAPVSLESARKSSYTDRSQLIVAESGARRARAWVSERADLASDFAKAFPKQPGHPVQLAVAADGDNTNSKGRAAFADIHFVGRGEPCAS